MKRKRVYDYADLFVYFSYELGKGDADLLYNAVALYQLARQQGLTGMRELVIVCFYMTCKRIKAWSLSFKNAIKSTGFDDLTPALLAELERKVLLATWKDWSPVRFFVGPLPIEDRAAVRELLEDENSGMRDFGAALQVVITKYRYVAPPPRPRKKPKPCCVVV